MSSVYFPATGFLLQLLPDDKKAFLSKVEQEGRLMSNLEAYQYFADTWDLPPMGEDDDNELAGARIVAAVAQKVADRFRPLLDPSVVAIPPELKGD